MTHFRQEYCYHGACWLFALVLLGSPWDVQGENKEFHFANLPNTYLGENVKENRLALQLIMKKAFHLMHPDIDLQLDFLAENNHLIDSIAAKGYDVLTMTGLDYLAFKEKIKLDPLAIFSREDQPTEVFLLIVPKGVTWETLVTRHKRTLITEKGSSGVLATTWMDTVLAARGLPPCNRFFSSVRAADKPSRAFLPVFFKQADICVVSQGALAVMSELNPNLSDGITILQHSDGLVNLLLCGTDHLAEWAKAIVLEQTMVMHTHPVGQQALTIIQMKRFYPFERDHLKATETLYQLHQKLLQGDR